MPRIADLTDEPRFGFGNRSSSAAVNVNEPNVNSRRRNLRRQRLAQGRCGFAYHATSWLRLVALPASRYPRGKDLVKNEPHDSAPTFDDHTLESTPQPEIDLIVEHWICIAAMAWSGLMIHGPGAVVLTINDGTAQPSYRPGSPCPCHPIVAETYDPRQQVVVVVVHGEARPTTPLILSGWPAPPDAHELATADVMGEVVH